MNRICKRKEFLGVKSCHEFAHSERNCDRDSRISSVTPTEAEFKHGVLIFSFQHSLPFSLLKASHPVNLSTYFACFYYHDLSEISDQKFPLFMSILAVMKAVISERTPKYLWMRTVCIEIRLAARRSEL